MNLGLLFLAFAGCAEQGGAPSSGLSIRDSLGIMIVEHHVADWSKRCPVESDAAVRIGRADGPEEEMLFRVFGARVLSDGRIVVVNQSTAELRWFDEHGRFLARAGRRGSGPGEFQRAYRMTVLPGDTIWVEDYPPWRFHLYGPDGRWIRTHGVSGPYALAPRSAVVLDDGRVVVGNNPRVPERSGFRERPMHVVLYRSDGGVGDTLGVFADARFGVLEGWERLSIYPHFESFFHLTGAGGRAVVGHGAISQFRVLEGDETLETALLVRWSGADRRVDPRHVTAEVERITARHEARSAGEPGADYYLGPLVSPERPVADSFPAFIALNAGRDGRIWMRDYPRGPEPGQQEWVGFRPDGNFECRVTLPPALDQVFEFGADYVIGVERDEMGVERVVRYGLGRPSPQT